MREYFNHICLCLLILAVPSTVTANIYRFVDESGVVNFTDVPKHKGYKIHIRQTSHSKTVSSPARDYYPYRTVVRQASEIYSIEEPLIRAVMEVESDYNRYAISGAGARGLMQLMPQTMKHLGVSNPWDPRQNIMGGARHLKGLMDRFSGNVHLALAAYNAGSNAVIRYGRIPPYPQTKRYVVKVMDRYRRFAAMEDH